MGCCDSRFKDSKSMNKETYEVKSISFSGTNRVPGNEYPDAVTPENKPQKNEFDTFSNNKMIDIDISDIHSEKTIISKSNKPTLKKIGDFTIRIFIEYLEINYKYCDDFGSYFKPFIEVCLENQVKQLKINDGDDLNNSGIADLSQNISMNTSRIDHRNLNVSISGKEKLYNFKNEIFFNGNEKFYYSFINFTVKNEFSSKNSTMLPIIVGDNKIPLNIVITANKERCFDGQIEIKLRNLTTIGLLKLNIQINDENSAKILSTMFNRKILDDMELSNDLNLINTEKKIVTWDKFIYNYYELDSYLIEKYFQRDSKTIHTRNLNLANMIINEKNPDSRALKKFYVEAVKEENYIALYEIFNILLTYSVKQEFNIISEFVRNMSEDDKGYFFNICFGDNFNAFIMKVFLTFFYNCQKYYKGNKSSIIRNNKFFNDSEIMEMMYKSIKKITQFMKNNSPNMNYLIQLRDCVIWCLNNLIEIITQPTEMQEKSNLEKNNLDQKIAEYTMIYDNCIILMGYRISLLKLIDAFYDDCQIMSGLFRILRKATQIITNESSPLLDKTVLYSNPKDISKKYKTLLIEKHDGVFLNSLRVMYKKFQHYPELHYNLLITLYQITSNIDANSLYLAAIKVDLDEFRENFSVYRGRIKSFSKMINLMHLKILFNFSQLIKIANDFVGDKKKEEEYYKLIYSIFMDIRAFYTQKKNDAKLLQDFIVRKYIEIEIHEILSKIVNNLTKHKEIIIIFWEEFTIIEDLMNFMFKIALNNNNYVNITLESRRIRSEEEGKKILSSIMENTLNIIINLFSFDGKQTNQFDAFIENLVINYVSKTNFIKILDLARKTLDSMGCNMSKIEICFNDLQKKIENYW